MWNGLASSLRHLTPPNASYHSSPQWLHTQGLASVHRMLTVSLSTRLLLAHKHVMLPCSLARTVLNEGMNKSWSLSPSRHTGDGKCCDKDGAHRVPSRTHMSLSGCGQQVPGDPSYPFQAVGSGTMSDSISGSVFSPLKWKYPRKIDGAWCQPVTGQPGLLLGGKRLPRTHSLGHIGVIQGK